MNKPPGSRRAAFFRVVDPALSTPFAVALFLRTTFQNTSPFFKNRSSLSRFQARRGCQYTSLVEHKK
jgi:hypothetical protein